MPSLRTLIQDLPSFQPHGFLLAGLLKKGSGKSAAPELSKGAAEGEGHTDGQTGQLGVCGILGQGRVYVGSSCMVDACSAMYQQIGIQVKWGEQASSVTGHCFHMLGVHLACLHSLRHISCFLG